MDTTGAVITDMIDYPGGETRVQVKRFMRDPAQNNKTSAPPRALLFDMDGTLSEPALEYPQIKAAMGIAVEQPILEALAEMPPSQRAAAEATLHEYEDRAARDSVSTGLRSIDRVVVDRKFKDRADHAQQPQERGERVGRHGLKFDLLITRECANGKSSPIRRPC
jgi:hypothetical protein